MDEVFQVVWENRVSIICIFDYYACLGGGFDGTLSLNPYTEFAEDCALASKASKFCKKSDLDRAFIAADAASNRLSGEEKAAGGANRGKALSPDEFILCLVNIAILRYVHEGTISDVSDAVGEDGGTNECPPHTALPPRARAPTHSLIFPRPPCVYLPRATRSQLSFKIFSQKWTQQPYSRQTASARPIATIRRQMLA